MGYIALTEDPHICQIGSTYEHTEEPDPKKVTELVEKVSLFYPEAKNLEVLKVRSGVRIAPRDGHLPIIAQVSKNTWIFTGLGSRGLLYHALFGRELIHSLI
jgi:glycine/D-amino acid oxidase-like deaminating enzyme